MAESVGAEEELHFKFDESEDAHAKFLPWHSSSQVPHVVHFFVPEDFSDNVSC